MKRSLVALALLGATALTPSIANAASITFVGSSGSLAAQATFNFTGTTLTIFLANIAPASSVNDPADVLSGLFFSLTGSPALIPVSAFSLANIANSGACTVNPCTGSNVNVGGENSYNHETHGLSNEAIASSGYLAGNTSTGNFGGSNLQNPDSLNGIEFGIVPLGYVDGQGNGGVNTQALVRRATKFVLTMPSALTIADVGNVQFQYGTALTETRFGTCTGPNCPTPEQFDVDNPVPEPATLALFGSGLGVLAARLRKKRKS